MRIHVVSFQVPFPPRYGGVIDVFYKIKALHNAGHRVVLHTFLYNGVKRNELEAFCSEVYYYSRRGKYISQLSFRPYIVESRRNESLINDLAKDNDPILFEGIHTCYYIDDPRLKNRLKLVRMHNVEHEYYKSLAEQTGFGFRKLYYTIESFKLRYYQRVLKYADRILAISQADEQYFKKRFPKGDICLLQCFFNSDFVDVEGGTKPYLFYHGNLEVAENITVVDYILDEIMPKIKYGFQLVVAGRKPSDALIKKISALQNVKLVIDPSEEEINAYAADARVNLMLTFRSTGIKLKLLNSLVKSRGYCLANDIMTKGNNLSPLCEKADSTQEIIERINILMVDSPACNNIKSRQKILSSLGYNDIYNIINK